LPVHEAVRLAIQIAGALEEAHAKGILHRDLKPANILLTAKRDSKLLDFGLAKLMDAADDEATKTIEGTMLGTAAYMSPEQAQAQPLDERSDIFSFGAVLYEMFGGRRAFPRRARPHNAGRCDSQGPGSPPSPARHRSHRHPLPAKISSRTLSTRGRDSHCARSGQPGLWS
jgi:serine/threonine protein kinase